MTTQNQIGYSNSWMQISALMPKPTQTPNLSSPSESNRYHKQRRSVATRTMVRTAIKTLMRNPRAGVSFMAIKKYIEENYYKDSFVSVHKRFHFVKRYIRNSLEKGELIRTKGNGVSGSFRLPRSKRMLKKKSNKKKANLHKRKDKRVKDIRKKVRKQLEELELNGRLHDDEQNADLVVEATACNAVVPMKAMSNVTSKQHIT